jgi:hypothetical protein
MTTQNNNTMCNHFFCTMPARAYSRKVAAYKVEQTMPNGNVRVTYACESDFAEMPIKATDTVTKL